MPDKALDIAIAKHKQGTRSFSLGTPNPANKPGLSSWGMLLVCAATILGVSSSAYAQSAPCGLTSVTVVDAPQYPPIAQVAHIYGTVILMVRFKPDGGVERITELSGPPMLSRTATSFLKSWKANEYSGPRECPMVLTFELADNHSCDVPPVPSVPYEQIDIQHVVVRGRVIPICDPEIYHPRKKRFLIF